MSGAFFSSSETKDWCFLTWCDLSQRSKTVSGQSHFVPKDPSWPCLALQPLSRHGKDRCSALWRDSWNYELWLLLVLCFSLREKSQELTRCDDEYLLLPEWSPPLFFASWANQASSGAMRKKLVRAFGFRVTPTSPLRLSVSNLFPLKHGPHPKHKMAHADSC